ncbi:MAG: Putative transmembrane protein, partial [uncultured Nocardioidaceae bacterium]
ELPCRRRPPEDRSHPRVPPVARGLRRLRRGAAGRGLPVRQRVPGRELPHRGDRPQAARAGDRAAHDRPGRARRLPLRGVARCAHRAGPLDLRHRGHPRHDPLHRPARRSVRAGVRARRVRRDPRPPRLQLGEHDGGDALRGARRAQARRQSPGAARHDARRPARRVRRL